MRTICDAAYVSTTGLPAQSISLKGLRRHTALRRGCQADVFRAGRLVTSFGRADCSRFRAGRLVGGPDPERAETAPAAPGTGEARSFWGRGGGAAVAHRSARLAQALSSRSRTERSAQREREPRAWPAHTLTPDSRTLSVGSRQPSRRPTATSPPLSGSKPHIARFLLLCSAITSEALNGISPLTRC